MWSFLAGMLLFVAAAATPGTQEFTIYSNPVKLSRGQVHNQPTEVISLPEEIINKYKGKDMGVVKFQLDIVRTDENGAEVRVPLNEVYNHHTIQVMGTQAVVSSMRQSWANGGDPLGPRPHCGNVDIDRTLRAAGWTGRFPKLYFGPIGGAEYRDADRDLPKPYRQIVESPEAFVAILHFINNQNVAGEYPLFECPCTSDRVINVTNGTIDGVQPLPFGCNRALIDEHNGDCSLAWYKGGYRCCENGAWVTEPEYRNPSQLDTYYAKFTFTIDDVEEDTVPAYMANLDGTGNNAEYDIPKCSLSDPMTKMEGDKCIHTLSFVQRIQQVPQVPFVPPSAKISLLTARGHQHVGGLGMELYDDKTGELICKSTPRYGNGTEAGNEKGFMVGVPPCVWGPPPLTAPPVFGLKDKLRIVSHYDATEGHHGVMAFWFMQVSVSSHLDDVIV